MGRICFGRDIRGHYVYKEGENKQWRGRGSRDDQKMGEGDDHFNRPRRTSDVNVRRDAHSLPRKLTMIAKDSRQGRNTRSRPKD